jgi:hypothetical protein
LVYRNTPLCRRCVVAWVNLTDSLDDALDVNQGADNLLKMVVDVELAGASFAKVRDERLTHNRVVRAVPRAVLPFAFRRCVRRRTRAECALSAPILVGPSDAAGKRWNIVNARHRHRLVARPALREGGGTRRMDGQTSETTNLGARTAPQALVPGSETQVRRKANPSAGGAQLRLPFERGPRPAEIDG